MWVRGKQRYQSARCPIHVSIIATTIWKGEWSSLISCTVVVRMIPFWSLILYVFVRMIPSWSHMIYSDKHSIRDQKGIILTTKGDHSHKHSTWDQRESFSQPKFMGSRWIILTTKEYWINRGSVWQSQYMGSKGIIHTTKVYGINRVSLWQTVHGIKRGSFSLPKYMHSHAICSVCIAAAYRGVAHSIQSNLDPS